ncbi:MAG: hypothetical protein J5926_06745 [Ruminococcus sp.]|nr:hypothetical protein [Ruminococcus sp.]
MKKSVIIALAAAGAAVLFLSQTVVKYHFIGNRCVNLDKHIEAYPYADADIPDDFTDYTIHGISLKAPDCLVPKIPEGRTADDAVRYFSNDTEKCDLQIFVYPEKKKPEYPTWKAIGEDGFFKSGFVRKGVEKMGYSIPDNHYELMYLLGTFDKNDCNKLSVSQVSAFSKLAVYKEIMTPAIIGIDDSDDALETPLKVEPHSYFYENDKVKMYIDQYASKGGRYSLAVECCDVNDLNSFTELVVMSTEPETAQKIAKTVCCTDS